MKLVYDGIVFIWRGLRPSSGLSFRLKLDLSILYKPSWVTEFNVGIFGGRSIYSC